MEALSMSILAVYCAIVYTTTVLVAESHVTPICDICVSPQQAPAPDIGSPAQAPISPAESYDGRFDVTMYGAIADGGTESSSAFLEAWDAACNHTGNSTFYIPEGTFLLGPVTFPGPCINNQSPAVEIRGTLMALPNLNAFPHSNWIEFRSLQWLNLIGENEMAIIDGQGAADSWRQPSCYTSATCRTLVTSLKFNNVTNGSIRNITLTNSKAFHISLNGCNNININYLTIIAPGDSPNTDGIHVSESTNVNIASSTIGVGDDCVSIGPGCINISVSDIICGPGHGISVGSLGKYLNEKDVTRISVTNCTINGTQNGVRIKSWPGAPASNASFFTFEAINMINVSNPIIIDQEYCPWNSCNTTSGDKSSGRGKYSTRPGDENPSLLKLSDIKFKNISGTYNTNSGVILLCSSDVPCENIHLADINLYYTTPESPREGRLNVKGIIIGLEILRSSFY